MTCIQDFIAEARTWEGTPFHHQGRKKGIGADCAGYLTSVVATLNVSTDSVPFNYAPRPDGKTLIEFLESSHLVTRCNENELPFEGAIGVFWINRSNKPQHFALFLNGKNGLNIIHATNVDGVKEVPFDQRWQKRLNSIWRLTFAE